MTIGQFGGLRPNKVSVKSDIGQYDDDNDKKVISRRYDLVINPTVVSYYPPDTEQKLWQTPRNTQVPVSKIPHRIELPSGVTQREETTT